MRPTSRFLALAVPALLAPALLAGCAAAAGDATALGASVVAEPAAPGPPGAAPAPVSAPDASPRAAVVAPRAPLTPVPPPTPDPAAVARDAAGATARDAVRPSVGSVGAAAPTPKPATIVQPSSAYATALFSGVNAERVASGLPALRSNACAQAAAQRWAEHLATTGDFAHQDIGAVLRTCSPATAAGENIARSPGDPGDVVSSWMASDGHRANILDGGYTHLGSAAVQMEDGRWVAVHVFLSL